MAPRPGDAILNGKYQILRLIGEGGMARVWLAEELTYDRRPVALKEPRQDLLPGDQQELLRRWQQEVQLCAALERVRVPHTVRTITLELLPGGTQLLVLEYLAGGSVADRIAAHPDGLPLEQALGITLDVLEALEGLHGLPAAPVHRDVKPENILLDEQGGAYLGDFGLAQLPGQSGRSRLLGRAHPGTPLYMAPEQGRCPDPLLPAADLYALGCVLFEMLTGQRYKRHRPGTLPGSLRPEVPGWLDGIVARALAEDPWDRYASAGEMAAALREGEAAKSRGVDRRAATTEYGKRRGAHPSWIRAGLLGLIVAVVVVLGASAPWWWQRLFGLPGPTLQDGATPTLEQTSVGQPASLPSATARQRPTQTPATPRASPTPLPPSLTPTPSPSWTASARPTSTLAPTSTPTPGPKPSRTEVPSSTAVLASPTPKPTNTPAPAATQMAVKPGLIAFASNRGGRLSIMTVGTNGLDLRQIRYDLVAVAREPSWSTGGSRLVFEGKTGGNYDIYVMRSDGSQVSQLAPSAATDRDPDWSPVGDLIAFESDREGDGEVYVIQADGSGLRRLTTTPGIDHDPDWSPDGTAIVFMSERDGNAEIYSMKANGSAQTRLTHHLAEDKDPAWSPDGTRIAFVSDRAGNLELYVMNADGSGLSRLTWTEDDEWNPTWSPDGGFLAYERVVAGADHEIWRVRSDGSQATNLTSNPAKDVDPAWLW